MIEETDSENDSRIKIASGFSLSLLNQNKWSNLDFLSELDTLAFDSTLDNKFLDFIELDSEKKLSQYESNYLFSALQRPLIPYFIKKSGAGFTGFIKTKSKSPLTTIVFKVNVLAPKKNTNTVSVKYVTIKIMSQLGLF